MKYKEKEIKTLEDILAIKAGDNFLMREYGIIFTGTIYDVSIGLNFDYIVVNFYYTNSAGEQLGLEVYPDRLISGKDELKIFKYEYEKDCDNMNNWIGGFDIAVMDRQVKILNEIEGVIPYKTTMPNITSHTFKNGLTTIEWSDGTKTKCYCDPEKADEYTGFMIALAKKAWGNDNTASNLADKWLVKIPKREAELKAKEEAEKIKQERIAENKARKREIKRRKRLIREEALKIKREYEMEDIQAEARKMAIEEFGVPHDSVYTV